MAKQNIPLAILYDDANVIAVDKPAGLAAIPGRAEDDSVLERLARQLGLPSTGTIDPRVRVVHRLDKDTSGVMLFAKDSPAQRYISHQFQNNSVQKEYLALVAGRPTESEGDIDAPIGPHATNKLKMAVLKHGGRPARTLWKVEQRFRELTLLRCFPKTGKTHQIRVHLAHAGFPLAIDPLYNLHSKPIFLSAFKRDYRPTRGEEERPLVARLTLHAHRLTFQTPQGQAMTIESPIPKDLRSAISQLGKLAAAGRSR